jgi:hypothetical protein
VLPIVLVVLALLAALFVSGVFGGSDPASGSGVTMPAEPADTTQPELVVVPGAKDAGADAVETAKSRARKGGDSGATKKDEADADSARRASAPAAGSPPPAPAPPPPAAPAVSADNPVTPPPPARATSPRPSGPKQIDAGGGATGAERLPPAADASDVPDLVPPPEPATP